MGNNPAKPIDDEAMKVISMNHHQPSQELLKELGESFTHSEGGVNTVGMCFTYVTLTIRFSGNNIRVILEVPKSKSESDFCNTRHDHFW